MNASSYITFFTYMLRQNGKRFYKGLFVTFTLAPTEALEGHFNLLIITYYLLLITYHLLLITYYLLLITYYLSLITYYLLLIISPGRVTVSNVSGNRCESDSRSRGRKFDPGPVPYFRGD